MEIVKGRGAISQILKNYEIEQYNKAILVGTDKAWDTYRRNVNRFITLKEKEFGVKVNRNAVFGGV